MGGLSNMSDPVEHSYLTIIQDKLIVPYLQTGFEKRLNAFFDQYIHNVYYYNIQDKTSNVLTNPMAEIGEKVEITIDGMKVIPLKGINSDAKKAGMMHDFSGEFTAPAYDSIIALNNPKYKGFYNPNLGLYTGGNFSYGCFGLDKFIRMDFTLSYNVDTAVPSQSGYVVMILAEVLRKYNRQTDKVSFVSPVKM
jgi:hypothetical protein